MTNEIQVRNIQIPAAVSWQEMKEMATVIAKSGLAPRHFDTPEKVLAAAIVARDLGLSPAVILQGGLYVVNGVVSANSRVMMSLILRSREVKVSIREDEREGWVEVTMERPSAGLSFTARWDEEKVQATRANIDPKTGQEKWPWRMYRQTMKRWRAIAEAARVVAPDIIGGIYLPDEVNVPTEVVDGDVVVSVDQVEAGEPDKPPTAPPKPQAKPQTEGAEEKPWKSLPRPWPPDVAIAAIRYQADGYARRGEGIAMDDGIWGATVNILNRLGDRPAFLRAVFGVASSKDLTDAQRKAIVSWLRPTKLQTGEWAPDIETVSAVMTEFSKVVEWQLQREGQQRLEV